MAFFIAVLIAFALPKRVECDYPGAECALMVGRDQCKHYEIEPWVFYGIEHLLDRDFGFAYSSGDDCR
jgi:hypothetical protein